MKIIFTICSNNYLAQALVLARSVQQHEINARFMIGLVDKKDPAVPYHDFGFEVIEAADIEPKVNALAEKYSIVELNTCLKPAIFQYFFEEYKADQVIYLDPDTCLYSPLIEIDKCLEDHEFVITPHILTPIPLDGYWPDESLFLNFGLYNLGFLALKKTDQTQQFLKWWKERTYLKGYNNPAKGLFTDQLWINLLPVYFNRVAILRHPGYNMGPWNLHERFLQQSDGAPALSSGEPLAFFHFSGFNPAVRKLHWDYTRFSMEQRPDLQNLFDDYKERIESNNYQGYSLLPCYYAGIRKQFVKRQKAVLEADYYAGLPYYKKMMKQIKRML